MYLQLWQDTLCDNSPGIPSFKFNSYLFVALVVSLFQIRKLLPSTLSLKKKQSVLTVKSYKDNELSNIYEYLLDFFVFYGEIYQHKNHIISPYTGELHFRSHVTSTGEHFTDTEKTYDAQTFAFNLTPSL